MDQVLNFEECSDALEGPKVSIPPVVLVAFRAPPEGSICTSMQPFWVA